MDLASRLELLLEIHQYGSFAKAADARGIDRSVLSKQIKKLEDSLGIRLINRSTRSISLTHAGVEIVKQAQKIRDTLDETRQLADTFSDQPKGQLRVSTTSLFGRKYLNTAMIAFLKKYPQVSIEVVLDDRKVDIISDRYDVVFRIGEPADSNLIARQLAEHKMVLLASNEFIEKYGNPQTPEELSILPSIIYSNSTFKMNKINLVSNIEDTPPTSVTLQGRYYANEVELLMEAAQASLGYIIVGQLMVTKHIRELGLVVLLPDYRITYSGSLYALYPHRNQPPLVKLFIDMVQETIGTPPVWENYLS